MNVLFVGLGSIAHKHITAINECYVKNKIYALRSSETANEVQGVQNIFSINEIEKADLDFIVISTPTALHKESIKNVLGLKKPLLIEKPLYHKLDIEDILLEVEQANILTYIACNLRFLESLQFVKSTIDQGNKIIHEVNCYCGSYLPAWRNVADYRQSYSARAELGGGVHLDLIHELDYLYWMLGEPEEVDRILRSKSALNIDAIDYANYRLLYDKFVANVILNYYRVDTKRTMEIVFQDNTWLVDLITNTVSVNNKIIFQSEQKGIDTYTAQMRYFYNCIKTNSSTFNSIKDGMNVLKMCLNA